MKVKEIPKTHRSDPLEEGVKRGVKKRLREAEKDLKKKGV